MQSYFVGFLSFKLADLYPKMVIDIQYLFVSEIFLKWFQNVKYFRNIGIYCLFPRHSFILCFGICFFWCDIDFVVLWIDYVVIILLNVLIILFGKFIWIIMS